MIIVETRPAPLRFLKLSSIRRDARPSFIMFYRRLTLSVGNQEKKPYIFAAAAPRLEEKNKNKGKEPGQLAGLFLYPYKETASW